MPPPGAANPFADLDPGANPFADLEQPAAPMPRAAAITAAQTKLGVADGYDVDRLAQIYGGARADERGIVRWPGEAAPTAAAFTPPTDVSVPYEPSFLENRVQEAKQFGKGFDVGGHEVARGLANVFGANLPPERNENAIANPQGAAGSAGNMAAQTLPWLLGPAGVATSVASIGGNTTQESLEQGDPLPEAVGKGIAHAGVAVVAPKAVTELAGPTLSAVAGRVGLKIAPMVGDEAAGVVERTLGAAGHNTGTGAALGLGSAGVSAAAGDTEQAQAELEAIPEQAFVMGALGTGIHLAGEVRGPRAPVTRPAPIPEAPFTPPPADAALAATLEAKGAEQARTASVQDPGPAGPTAAEQQSEALVARLEGTDTPEHAAALRQVTTGPSPVEGAAVLADLDAYRAAKTPEAASAALDAATAKIEAMKAKAGILTPAPKAEPVVPEAPRAPTAEEVAALPPSERAKAINAVPMADRPSFVSQVFEAGRQRRLTPPAPPAASKPIPARAALPVQEPGPVRAPSVLAQERALAPAEAAPEAPLTVDSLRAQLTAAYSKTSLPKERQAEVVDTAHDLLHAAAKATGETPEAFIQRRIRRIESVPGLDSKHRGAVEFLQDGKAVVRIMQSGNEETIGHELFHVFRRYLKPTDLAIAEQHLKVGTAGWTTAKEEAFVKAAMQWKAKGESPTAPLAGTFAKFKQWFGDLYDSVKGRGGKTSPELEKVFRNIFTPGEGLQAEYRPTGGEVTEAPAKPATQVPPAAKPVSPTPEAARPVEAPKAAPEVKAPAVDTAPAREKPAAPKPDAPTTGIANEITDADRERLGLPPRETPAARDFDEMFAAGKAKAAADATALPTLLDDLRKNPERTVSDTEVGMLVKHKVDLENGLQELLQRADRAASAGDANGELIARAQLDAHRQAMRDFVALEEQSGTASARALAARQMLSGMDYSLSHMEAEAEAAKGTKLTDFEQRKVRTLYQTIAEKTAATAKAKTLANQTQLEAAKRRWQEEVQRHENAKRTTGEKAVAAVKSAPGFFKSIKASLDNSAVFRQGWRVMFTNPIIWQRNALRTFEDAWKTFGGKEVMDEVQAELKLNPYYEQAKQAKLAIGQAEEAFPTSLPAKIPVLGRVYRASENAYTAFQYRNRIQVFEKMMDVAKRSGVDITDPQQLKAVGKLVNSLTGRASLGKLEPVGDIVNNVFFSARKLKADLDFLTLHAASKDFTAFARKQALQNVAKAVGGTAMILLIAKALAPDSVDFDPRSANYGKIRVKNTRFDVTGGASSILTLAARLASMSTKSATTGDVHDLNTGKFGSPTAAGVIGDFAANKLSPLASVLLNHLRGQRFNREKPTLKGDLEDLLVPMAITNFLELQNDEKATPEMTAAGVAADFFGSSVNTYGDGKKKKK